jgi:DNA-binding NarL/FixJ family response regulator
MQVPPATSKEAPLSEYGARRRISLTKNKADNIVEMAQDTQLDFRALIVDRDSMSSEVLAKVLVSHCRCEAVAISSEHLLPALSAGNVDLVVVGADLDGESGRGFDLAYKVGCAHPDTGIVILLNHSTRESVIHAFRSGARGVFSRQQPTSEFLDCVEDVRRGFIWAGREETNSLLKALRNIPAPNLVTTNDSPTLTARELEVVRCAAEGKTNKVIARDLGVSEHTVKNHLFRAFDKLGVSSRVELLFYLTLRGHTFSTTKFADEDLVLG